MKLEYGDTLYKRMVPKGFVQNLEYRQHIRSWASGRPERQHLLWIACGRDPLFYINTFCWIFEPRSARALPFITYPFQDGTILKIIAAIGAHDLVTEKSRDMGASWMHLVAIEWCWHFLDRFTALLLSRKAELVDMRGDPKALFYKIDFVHTNQPTWLCPRSTRNSMFLGNNENGATLGGESTNEFAGVADRRTCILLDEFSKMDNQAMILRGTRDVTRSRLFNFTPQGAGNSSYKIAHNPKFKKIRLHWPIHPLKNQGLYTSDKRGVCLLDRPYWADRIRRRHEGLSADTIETLLDSHDTAKLADLCDFRFLLDGKVRSVWYDNECDRAANPMEIAQELDIDYLGSDYQFYPADVLDQLSVRDVRHPLAIGDLVPDSDTKKPTEFSSNEKGPLKLWIDLDERGLPPSNVKYVIGADVSSGTGASFSVACVCQAERDDKGVVCGVQVAEWESRDISPEEFGEQVFALATWFDAFVIWEANGPGRPFGTKILTLGWQNVYYREQEDTAWRRQVRDKVGFWTSVPSKAALLSADRHALKIGRMIVRSYEAIEQRRRYVFTGTGIVHSSARDNDDPSATKDNHGDHAIAGSLCTKALGELAFDMADPKEETPYGTFAWRRKEWEREQKEVSLY